MSNSSNNQGRAYEFACLETLYKAISPIRPAKIITNSSYYAAKTAWQTLTQCEQQLYMLSASAIIKTIFAAGCGGLDLGFKKAGFTIIWANESLKSSSHNFKYLRHTYTQR